MVKTKKRTKTSATKTPPLVEWREMSLAELKPADYNPRKITEHAMQGLQNSLEEFGVVQNVVFNSATGLIVGGHQRWEALRRMGVDKVMTAVVHIEDPRREKALNATLNNPAIQGTWDDDKLQEMLAEVAVVGDDELTEFAARLRIDELLNEDYDVDLDELRDKGEDDDEEDSEEGEGDSEEDGDDGDYVRTVNLYMDAVQHAEFQQAAEKLRKRFGVETLTDAVFLAVTKLAKKKAKPEE